MTNEREIQDALKELPRELRFAFQPLIKRALGFAIGLTLGLILMLLTTWHWLFDPDHALHLWLLGNYFAGYRPDHWSGPFVGFLWAAWVGFAMGFFVAWMRNFVVAVWIFYVRTKANLSANRDFLDHI